MKFSTSRPENGQNYETPHLQTALNIHEISDIARDVFMPQVGIEPNNPYMQVGAIIDHVGYIALRELAVSKLSDWAGNDFTAEISAEELDHALLDSVMSRAKLPRGSYNPFRSDSGSNLFPLFERLFINGNEKIPTEIAENIVTRTVMLATIEVVKPDTTSSLQNSPLQRINEVVIRMLKKRSTN